MRTVRTFFLLFGLLLAVSVSATEVQKFKTSIMTFLKEEGYMPKYGDDQRIVFKKEGVEYWIDVKENNPIFIQFHREGLGCADADRGKVLEACNYGNLKALCAKAYASERTVSFAVEMFCHSQEEFRYVFYGSISQLDKIYNYVKEYYNREDSNVVSQSSSVSSVSGVMSNFFPVYGFTLGRVTTSDFVSSGYEVETLDSGSKNCDVYGLTYWDHNKDDVYEVIYTIRSDQMPNSWTENVGLTWSLSYNEVVSLFKGLGFSMSIDEAAAVKEYDGRKVLSAEIIFTSPDGRYSFEFDFNYGNREGEGSSLNSKNSLYSIRVKSL